MRSSRNFPAMQAKIGALLAVAVALLMLALLVLPTMGVNPFASKVILWAYFTDISGLRTSAPVWLSGVEVGTVKSVHFTKTTLPLRIRVQMKVERSALPYLRSDSQAIVKGMGLLGDMFIELTPGTPAGTPIGDGAVLAGIQPEKAQDEVTRVVDTANKLLKNLQDITDSISNGQGTLGKLIQNPQLYDTLQAAANNLQKTLEALNSREGTAGKLLQDSSLYDSLLATVNDTHGLICDLQNAEKSLVGPETRVALKKTTQTVGDVMTKVDNLLSELERIRYEFYFGVDKYALGDLVSGQANLLIWPNNNRYYDVGVKNINRLYGNETDNTTFEGELAWRILDTPLFIRGGITKSNTFVAGLDVRSWDRNFKVLVDAYHLELNPFQADITAAYKFWNLIELSAGAEDIFRVPFYKAGLTIYYSDADLMNVYIRTRF